MTGLILKLGLLPFAESVDADAFSRISLSEKWLDNPEFYSEGVWLPIHYYLNGFVIWLTSEHHYGPMVLHVLFSVATIIPLYQFTKREFNERGALIVAVLWLVSPLIFRYSYEALSGIPHAFFIAMTLNYLSLALDKGKLNYAVYAGLCITIAAGLRYEAWLIIGALSLMILLRMDIKVLLYFLISAVIFPVFWMIGNYIAHGHPLYGVTGVYNLDAINVQNANISTIENILRLSFFPLFLIILLSPILTILLFVNVLKRWKSGNVDLNRVFWSLPLFILMISFLYKAYSGTLLLQHRFLITPLLLSLPFYALLFEYSLKRWSKLMAIAGILAIPLVQIWFVPPIERITGKDSEFGQLVWRMRVSAFANLSPIPFILDPEVEDQKKVISSNLHPDEGLVIDFDQYTNSFNIAIDCSGKARDAFVADPGMSEHDFLLYFEEFIDKHEKGIILYKCQSVLSSFSELKGSYLHFNTENEIVLHLKPEYSKDGLNIFSYNKIHSKVEKEGDPIKVCPDQNTASFLRMEIRKDASLTEDIYYKSTMKGVSFEEQLEMDVEWLQNNPN